MADDVFAGITYELGGSPLRSLKRARLDDPLRSSTEDITPWYTEPSKQAVLPFDSPVATTPLTTVPPPPPVTPQPSLRPAAITRTPLVENKAEKVPMLSCVKCKESATFNVVVCKCDHCGLADTLATLCVQCDHARCFKCIEYRFAARARGAAPPPPPPPNTAAPLSSAELQCHACKTPFFSLSGMRAHWSTDKHHRNIVAYNDRLRYCSVHCSRVTIAQRHWVTREAHMSEIATGARAPADSVYSGICINCGGFVVPIVPT